MTEVSDIAGSIELNADNEDSFLDKAKSLAEQVPGAKQAIKGYDTVTNIWQGMPEDPDAADIMLHAGGVITDAASFTAECAMEAGMAALSIIMIHVTSGQVAVNVEQPSAVRAGAISGTGRLPSAHSSMSSRPRMTSRTPCVWFRRS